MARNRYTVTAPDGQILECTSPDYVEHNVVVIGLMRLRKPLPKINPDDEAEETRYDRFRSWIMIGGAENEAKAEKLAASQVYHNITDEIRIIPVTATKVVKGVGDEEEPLKVVVEATDRELPNLVVHESQGLTINHDPAAVLAVDLDALD
jgi:hypothetical protein